MAEKPLVRGGVYEQKRYDGTGVPPVSFPTTVPPTVEKDTCVVAAASPTGLMASPLHDGWFLSDFYGLNHLLNGLGHRQVWLTAMDPQQLVARHGEYLHGNPWQDRKVVLSQDMIDKKTFTPVTVVDSSRIIDRFLKEVRDASEVAAKKNAPLLLMLFCHGTSSWTYLLDGNQNTRGLTVNRLKGAIHPGCRVTLYTTACFSSGWLIKDLSKPLHSPLNATAMTAASPWTESIVWPNSASIGRACGSVFTSSVINSLTSSASPLLPAESRDDTDGATSLQPEQPSQDQTKTYNAFAQSIIDTCRTDLTRLWEKHHFTFSVQNDQFEHSWTGKTGFPLSDFKKRWDALPTHPWTGDLESRLSLDQTPGETDNTADDGNPNIISKTGGVKVMDRITSNRIRYRIAGMAASFLEACPGDWDAGHGPAIGSLLRDAVRGVFHDDSPYDVAEMLIFRWELCLFADYCAAAHRLKLPDDQPCIMWDRHVWQKSAAKRFPGVPVSTVYEFALSEFQRRGLEPEPTIAQGPQFSRFSFYMAALVVEANKPRDETLTLIASMVAFVQDVTKYHEKEALANSRVLTRGRSWLSGVGRRIRRSLSPRKKSVDHRDRSDSAVSHRSRGGSGSMGFIPDLQPSSPSRGSFDLQRKGKERRT